MSFLILDECKTIKTKHLLVKLFRCDQGDALGDIRLKNREDMHAGNKRYKCGKELRQRQNLQRHIRTPYYIMYHTFILR
jgi:NADH:ubiquinone oxidoreductase subunit 3 (subunit A)